MSDFISSFFDKLWCQGKKPLNPEQIQLLAASLQVEPMIMTI